MWWNHVNGLSKQYFDQCNMYICYILKSWLSNLALIGIYIDGCHFDHLKLNNITSCESQPHLHAISTKLGNPFFGMLMILHKMPQMNSSALQKIFCNLIRFCIQKVDLVVNIFKILWLLLKLLSIIWTQD